ncbi:SDR family NAD(P)-dependent oxidoreductase, partial [Rhizobium sp. S-51]|nr:SDR family NAD(P)-dependent oxidoreductase [Rhizobium terricola]
MPSLQNKRVVVTAAGQGIGRASALAFAAAGARVLATDINEAALGELAGQGGGSIETARLDVLDEAMVKDVIGRFGDVDVLFNCAGVVHGGTVLDMADKDLDFAFDLNVRAMIRTIRAVLPGMIARGDGSIINMASVASSVKGVPNRCAYTV